MNWLAEWLYGADEGHVLQWLGEDEDLTVTPGSGPVGVATFVLELENGYTVTYRWPTDVIKTRSGKEQRISRNDRAKESYEGSILLPVDQAVSLRNTLARTAHLGSEFLLGLPHEALSMRLASVGTTVYVHTTTLSDWPNAGQRVIVARRDPDTGVTTSVEAVVQSSTANTIILDVEPGTTGGIGGVIMPAQAILLDPEQAFPRYPTELERWEIRAMAASFGFAAELPSLALGPLTISAGLDSAIVSMRSTMAQVDFALDGDPLHAADGEFFEVIFGGVPLVLFRYRPGVTTIQKLVDAMATSTYLDLTGVTSPASTLQVADEMGESVLSVGASGPVGTGVTVATYDSRPLWDAYLENDGTITDSIHAMTEILDYGGIPDSVGSADAADWGRSVSVSGLHGEDFQWLKLFLATVKGRQKAFWLPTWRNDLEFVSKAAGTVTVSGDVAAWYPALRQHVQIVEVSGTITRAEIAASVDNGDGTYTLTIGATLATAIVESVSWIELARFSSDQFSVTFDAEGWHMETTATVVQR